MAAKPKTSLKRLLVTRGLAESETRAEAFVLAGKVRVAGEPAKSAGMEVPSDIEVTIENEPRYVSRSAEKLLHALEAWKIEVTGRTCADIGSSTGGFTQVLLEKGAKKVFAVDVGSNELAWKLRNDPRVVVMEGVNARKLEAFNEPVSLVTIDVSFISVEKILPNVQKWWAKSSEVPRFALVLIKPQFEARREEVPVGGVIEDTEVQRSAIRRVLHSATQYQLVPRALLPAKPRGASGNQEFVAWLEHVQGQEVQAGELVIQKLVEDALIAAQLNNNA